MKKLLIMAVALLTAGVASAQMTYSIGYLNKNSKTDVSGGGITISSENSMSGFSIGLDDNINLTGDLNVAVGAAMEFYFKKDGDYKYKDFNLAVPVDFNYGFALGSSLKLFVFAGPTLNLGIISDQKGPNDSKWNYYASDEGDNSRLDVLVGGGAWLDIQDQFRIKAGYKVGMMDRCKKDGITIKDNVFSVSLGYIF